MYRVYLPDYFHGEDLGQLSKSGKDRSELVPYLLGKYHPRDAAWPISAQSVADIKEAQKSVKKIGAIGYCWGATSVLHLSGKSAGDNQVDAIAFCHPSVIEATDFEQLDRPGLFLCCEQDSQFPKEKQEASKLVCEKRAKDADVFSKFGYYPRVAHGWSIKGDETEPYSAKAMSHAATEVIGFFSLELN